MITALLIAASIVTVDSNTMVPERRASVDTEMTVNYLGDIENYIKQSVTAGEMNEYESKMEHRHLQIKDFEFNAQLSPTYWGSRYNTIDWL